VSVDESSFIHRGVPEKGKNFDFDDDVKLLLWFVTSPSSFPLPPMLYHSHFACHRYINHKTSSPPPEYLPCRPLTSLLLLLRPVDCPPSLAMLVQCSCDTTRRSCAGHKLFCHPPTSKPKQTILIEEKDG